MYNSVVKSVAVIGAGVAGVSVAKRLATEGYEVTLYEERSELLSGSSDATPCRLGIGFHYPDEETALQCLHTSLNFIKSCAHYKFGEDFPKATILQRCRYYIVKNSQFPKNKILHCWKKIQLEYARLVALDSKNAVFGPPQNFLIFLRPDEYKNDIEISEVEMAVETAECFLNWPRYKQDLIAEILENDNITVKIRSEIVDVKQNEDGSFKLLIRNNKTNCLAEQAFPFVVNASWQNIESLDIKAGFKIPEQYIPTNRTKVMIEVHLPEELVDLPSAFFCFGLYCAFTNLGLGRGFITYEPVTNIFTEKGPYIPEKCAKYLMGEIDEVERKELGRKIIEGVSKFIPAMHKAKYMAARFGNVKTFGDLDLQNPFSAHHKRRDFCVRALKIGWIDNPSMKLVNCQENAEIVLQLIKKQEFALATMKTMSSLVAETIEFMSKNHFLDVVYPSPMCFKIISDWKHLLANEVISLQKIQFNHAVKDSHLAFWYDWVEKITGIILKDLFIKAKPSKKQAIKYDSKQFERAALEAWISQYVYMQIDPNLDVLDNQDSKQGSKNNGFLSKIIEKFHVKFKSHNTSNRLISCLQVKT